MTQRLYNEFRIEAPLFRWNGLNLIRISVQGYNGPLDIERLLGGLKRLI